MSLLAAHGAMMAVGGGAAYLDELAVAPRVALGLKKLISTATTAVRVRRSNDDTEQDIGFDGDALDTMSLAAFVGSNSGYVTKLYDQTGNGEHAEQTTSAKQPRLVNAGVFDGKLMFDGSNDCLVISNLSAGAPQLGFFARMQIPPPTGSDILFEQSANYNSSSQSMAVYTNETTGKLVMASLNSVGGSNYREQSFPITFNSMLYYTVLFNRALTGVGEEITYQSGSSLTGSSISSTEQTGVFNTYDLHIAARGGSSLFMALQLSRLAIYNTDASSIRTEIEAVISG